MLRGQFHGQFSGQYIGLAEGQELALSNTVSWLWGWSVQSAAVSCHHDRTLQGPVHSEQPLQHE